MQIKIGEKVVDVKKQTWPVAKEPPQKEEFQKQATFLDHHNPKPNHVLGWLLLPNMDEFLEKLLTALTEFLVADISENFYFCTFCAHFDTVSWPQ